MSKKVKEQKGASAAEDQGTPGDAKMPPAPDASSAAASRNVVGKLSLTTCRGGERSFGHHLLLSRTTSVACFKSR